MGAAILLIFDLCWLVFTVWLTYLHGHLRGFMPQKDNDSRVATVAFFWVIFFVLSTVTVIKALFT